MPYNENFISPGSITPNYPGTNNPVTHSFEERQLIAEFDDILILPFLKIQFHTYYS